ncbi:MAG TPA: dihydrodipicolinate synthase family protein [Rhizomicrobium sp.]|nr:dihydrodipicolinate synthase family protein [Rhizomicrobium sp.]
MTDAVTFTRRRSLELSLGLLALAPVAVSEPAQAADKPADKPLRGIMPIVTTPYTPAGAIDFDDLAREMRFFDRIGCTGAVWPQGSSDVNLMTREERLQGMQVIAQACRPLKVASILGVQAATTAEMLDYARHAEELQADAVIAMPPSARDEQTVEGFHAYFAALAKAVRRPVVIQTDLAGARDALTPPIELLLQLAREFPGRIYVKEESAPLVERMKEEVKHHDLLKGVFGASGGDGLLYEMRLGLDGEMTGQGAYGDVMVAVFELYARGKREAAADAYAKWLLMRNCEAKIPGTQRYIFVKRGVFKSTATRRGAVGAMSGSSFAPDAIAEIEMRFATLKSYLRAD